MTDLNSRQVVRILDLLSEGEIEGFPSAQAYAWGTDSYNTAMLKDVFFNNTPVLRKEAVIGNVQTSDYNFNLTNAVFTARKGTQDQTYTDIIGDANQKDYPVGVKVTYGVPVTRSITDTDVTSVRVIISVPTLAVYQNNGNIDGLFVSYQIQTSYAGGPFTTVIDNTITGRTTNLYQKAHLITLTRSAPVDIRVVRTKKDAPPPNTDKQTEKDEIYWASYTEKVNAKTNYPNSALFGLKIDAEQFPSIPSRTYRIRGIKVAIPSNATVDATNGRLIYAGVWNGTFQAAQWTSDPAWILWDLLVSKRYGTGDHIDASQLDKWAFYSCSQYASALVPDGFGGMEPRFSCNVNIQTQEETFKLINSLASTMRCMPFWSSGSLTLSQDAPADAAFVFNQANVTQAGFSYSGSSLKTRHTVVAVSYLDLELRDKAWEVVEDKDGINKFGVVKAEVEAYGCTSRGQARRLAEWMLYEEQNATETVNFVTDISAGITVRPGDIIKIADPSRAGIVRAGRCSAGSTTTRVILDRPITDIGASFTLNVMLQDGQIAIVPNSTISGNIVTPGTALTYAPVAGAPYGLGDSTVALSLWRVLAVQEQPDGVSYAVTALAHDPTKYDYIERNVPLQPRVVSALNNPPETPTGLKAIEVLYENNGIVLSKLILNWQPSARAVQYEVLYSVNNGNPTPLTTSAPDAEILNSDVGTYNIQIRGIGTSGKRSSAAEITFVAVGKTAAPNDIADLQIAPIDDKSAELYWPQAVDIDVRIGGQVRIRYCPLVDNTASWGKSNDIVPAVPGNATRAIVPLLSGTYFIRAVDSLGNESPGVQSVVVSLPAPQDALLVQQYQEETSSPPFAGTGSSMSYNLQELGLVLAGAGLVDDFGTWDSLGLIDYIGGSVGQGSYIFKNQLDLGAVYDLDIQSVIQTRAYEPQNYLDTRLALIDDWNDIDGADLGAVNTAMAVRVTNDNPSGTPTWSDWQPFVNNTQRGRGFQFKLTATADNPGQNLVVSSLGVITQFQRRTETQRNLTSGAATYTVTYPTAFYDVPSVGITAQDLGNGGYFTIANASRTGFQITFRNSAGTIVSKVFDYQAVGHGRQIS